MFVLSGASVFLLVFLYQNSDGKTEEGCFTLYYNFDKRYIYWSHVQKDIQVSLSCTSGTIQLNRYKFSLPSHWEDYCRNSECWKSNDGQKICKCCTRSTDDLCEKYLVPGPERETCEGGKHCTLTVPKQDLSDQCALNKLNIDYKCLVGPYNHCHTRWIEVDYDCIPEKTPVRDGMPTDGRMNSQQQLHVTGLTAGLCVVILLVIVISVICCIRYKRLQKKYKNLERLASHRASAEDDTVPGIYSEPEIQFEANGHGNGSKVKYNNNNPMTSQDDGRGKETDCVKDAVEVTYNNVQEDTQTGSQPGLYAAVQTDLKKKNRGESIDGSNQWTDPEKRGSAKKMKSSGDSQNKGQKSAGQSGEAGDVETGSDCEMVENILYER